MDCVRDILAFRNCLVKCMLTYGTTYITPVRFVLHACTYQLAFTITLLTHKYVVYLLTIFQILKYSSIIQSYRSIERNEQYLSKRRENQPCL